MHLDRPLSPRALLSALLLGLLALAVVPNPGKSAPAAAPLSPSSIPADTVSVRFERGNREDTRDSPVLQEVRDLLELPLLQLGPRDSKVDVARYVLVDEYGSLVKETPIEMAYLFVWTGERWIVICLGGASFELDFGSDGVVVVEARDGEIL